MEDATHGTGKDLLEFAHRFWMVMSNEVHEIEKLDRRRAYVVFDVVSESRLAGGTLTGMLADGHVLLEDVHDEREVVGMDPAFPRVDVRDDLLEPIAEHLRQPRQLARAAGDRRVVAQELRRMHDKAIASKIKPDVKR